MIHFRTAAHRCGQINPFQCAGFPQSGESQQRGQHIRCSQRSCYGTSRGSRHPQEERHPCGLIPGSLLQKRSASVRPEHFAVVGSKDKNGVRVQTGGGERGQQLANTAVQRSAVRIIPLSLFAGCGFQRRRNVRRQNDFFRRIEFLEFRRSGLMRKMRGSVGDHQDERTV